MAKVRGHLVTTDDPQDDVAIRVQNVSKSFKLPHNKQNSIKGGLINIFNGDRSYEEQEVLKDVSFEIKKGEFFGIVGRNGSGKSTLLKMLAGIYTPSSGTITINGSLTPFIELGVGFNPELTGRENVFLNGALLGFNRNEMAAMYDDIVEFAELERFMDQKLKNYSSGMQVRLAFSIAIRAQADILLLDEVLAVGDAAFQQKCFDYFSELQGQNKTLVLVTHDMSAVNRFCDKALYIHKGVIEYIGEPDEVANKYLLENLNRSQPAPKEKALVVDGATLNVKKLKQTDDKLVLEFKYQNAQNMPEEDMYLGLSILFEGVSVAEIQTPSGKPLRGKGTIRYEMDLRNFNAGAYQLSAVLCGMKKRQLLALGDKNIAFIVPGNDPDRGAALKLGGDWSY